MREVRDRYEIFLKVCETGNFTKAAEALNYTQSGISQMMAGLEEELGVQLFARAKKGVVLTDNGQRLIPYIREMVNQKEKLRQAAFNINNKVEGRLRIGSFSSVTAMSYTFSRRTIRRSRCRSSTATTTRSMTGSSAGRWTAAFSRPFWRRI